MGEAWGVTSEAPSRWGPVGKCLVGSEVIQIVEEVLISVLKLHVFRLYVIQKLPSPQKRKQKET